MCFFILSFFTLFYILSFLFDSSLLYGVLAHQIFKMKLPALRLLRKKIHV